MIKLKQKTIKLSIQEIIYDFYSLGETEGYLTGLAEGFELSEKDIKTYFNFMKDMGKKYLPRTFNDFIEKENNDLENGMNLSNILYENFKEMFCQLV